MSTDKDLSPSERDETIALCKDMKIPYFLENYSWPDKPKDYLELKKNPVIHSVVNLILQRIIYGY